MRPLASFALAAAAWTLAACNAMGPAPGTTDVALANPGFEDGPAQPSCARGWYCSMHADPTSFRFTLDESGGAGGKRSLCIEPVKREPWGMATQALLDPQLRGKRIRFSLAVRTEGVAGRGAGPIIVAHGGSGQRLAHVERWVGGTQGWQRLSVEMDVPADARDVQMGGELDGRGRACIDDARLEVLR